MSSALSISPALSGSISNAGSIPDVPPPAYAEGAPNPLGVWQQVLSNPGSQSETRFYISLFQTLHPESQNDPRAASAFVKNLQDATARALSHVPRENAGVPDAVRRVEAEVRLGADGFFSHSELERRYDLLPRQFVEGGGVEGEETGAASLPDDGFRFQLARGLHEGRVAFWTAAARDLNTRGNRLLHLPADPNNLNAWRAWALAQAPLLADVRELVLNNAQDLRILTPDLLLFPNLERLTINGTTSVRHLPEFLAQLPGLQALTCGPRVVDIHPEVWKFFEWDSMTAWMNKHLGANANPMGGQIFNGPGRCIPEFFMPSQKELNLETPPAQVPLRQKVREAMMCDCTVVFSFVSSIVLACALLFFACTGLAALLFLLLPPIVALLLYFIVVFTVLLSAIDAIGLGAVAFIGICTLVIMSLWTSFIYYVLEPLVCAVAWMCGKGWNPLMRA